MAGGAAAQLQLPYYLPAQACQRFALGCAEVMGCLVDDAQGAEWVAVGGDQWGAGIEADIGRPSDQRVAAKTWIFEGVGHLEDILLVNGVGAEGQFARGFLRLQADPALEPLAVGIDQRNQSNGCATQVRGELGEVVEFFLCGGVEHVVAQERGQALGLVRGHCWRAWVER